MDEERLPWHQELWSRLRQRRAAGRLPHALLLAGPAGLGKGRFARRLARTLLCQQPDEADEACGRCRSCRLFQAGTHPDYCVARPEEESRTIKVDQIRGLCAFLGFTAHQGGYKIALVEPADRLNLNAANSLLKTLEEPPGDGLLLLVSSRPSQLPATVRSRCQKVDFAAPPATVARAWLAARIEGDPPPELALEVAHGAPLAALAEADGDRWRRRCALFDCYQAVLAGDADPIRAAETWTQGDPLENLRWLIGWHTDLIRLKMDSDPPRLSHPDLRPALRRWADRGTPRALFERLDATVRLHGLCSTTQVNIPLLLEAFFSETFLHS